MHVYFAIPAHFPLTRMAKNDVFVQKSRGLDDFARSHSRMSLVLFERQSIK